MKERPEDKLLSDLFDGTDSFRTASLEATLSSVRRYRRAKVAMRSALAIAFVATVSSFLLTRSQQQDANTQLAYRPVVSPINEKPVPTIPGTRIRELSDDELLAAFPNRPVAIIGPEEERQLILLDDHQVIAALETQASNASEQSSDSSEVIFQSFAQ